MTADGRLMIGCHRLVSSSSSSTVVTLQCRVYGRHGMEDVVQLLHLVRVRLRVVGLQRARLGRTFATGRGGTEAGSGGGRRGGCRQSGQSVVRFLWKLWQSAAQPSVFQRFARCHALFRVPFQAAVNEIQEIRVVAIFQYLPEIPGTGRATVLPFPGETAVQHDRTVGHRYNGAVARITLRADELPTPFRGF